MHTLSRRGFLAAAAIPFLPRLGLAEAKKLNSINAFAADLYGQLRAKAGNVFLSPYSISTALAMTAAGAKGATLEQMQKVLRQPADEEYQAIAKSLAGRSKEYELAVANALWAQTGHPWADAYKARVTKTFDAGVHDADYAKPDAARQIINDWVAAQTKDKIKDLLPSGSVTSMTRLVLTNAIYFKGDWQTAFLKPFTQDLPFTALDGKKKNVPLMYRTGTIDFARNDSSIAVRLPYKGNEVSMLAVLPADAAKFADLERSLAADSWTKWADAMKPTEEVKVWLPRFKVETQYTLNEPLIALGMPDAFEKKADFGAMFSDSSQRLMISLVVHKAFVDVNEQGTEAAAATGAVGNLPSPPPPPPKIFRADRPFLFALRHEPTGTILFQGRYTTP